MNGVYMTTYCNHGHRVSNGTPDDHECVVIPPSALRAEMAGDYRKAIEIMEQKKPLRVVRGRGVR